MKTKTKKYRPFILKNGISQLYKFFIRDLSIRIFDVVNPNNQPAWRVLPVHRPPEWPSRRDEMPPFGSRN